MRAIFGTICLIFSRVDTCFQHWKDSTADDLDHHGTRKDPIVDNPLDLESALIARFFDT
jgi:hypothetical protein